MDTAYFKDSFHFSQDKKTPLYQQLASFMRVQIQAGILAPGAQMIPENELCAILGISRTTVRQAMNLLVKEGILVRYSGRGSFIAEKKVKRSMNHLYSFTEDMLAAKQNPSSVILAKEVINGTAECAWKQHLPLPGGQTAAFHLTRLRCADNVPLLWEDTYIPHYLCPGIEQIDFASTSLYTILRERYQLNPYHAKETIEAIIIDQATTQLLKCEPPSPGYRITRRSYLDSGFLFEYTTSVTRADTCIFEVDLFKPNTNGEPAINLKRQIGWK